MLTATTSDVEGTVLNAVDQEFDVLNRMTHYNDDESTATYTYYPNDLRKSKTVNGITTTHIWMYDEIQLDITGGNTVSYLHGLNLIKSDCGWYTYHAHGSVISLLDNNGEVIRSYKYDPYGIQLDCSTADSNPYRYCGEYLDNETGYIYLRARYYDPSIGRFINVDPAHDGQNWYVYCANNPIIYI